MWSPTVSHVAEGRAHTKGQEAAQNHARAAFKAGQPAEPKVAVTFGAVQHKAMLEHFRQIACVSVVYSLPSHSAVATSLADSIAEPAHKRTRLNNSDGADGSDRIHFRVTSIKKLNLQTTVSLSPAVAEKFTADDIAITMHSNTSAGLLHEEPIRVYCEPLATERQGRNPVLVLSDLTREVAELREEFTSSDIQGDLFWMIADMADDACPTDAFPNVISQLVGCGAFPTRVQNR
jgi:hypothetical protein